MIVANSVATGPLRATILLIKSVRKGVGVNPSLSLIFYKNFITFAKDINCFRILFAC